jgi:hypothetical protein
LASGKILDNTTPALRGKHEGSPIRGRPAV